MNKSIGFDIDHKHTLGPCFPGVSARPLQEVAHRCRPTSTFVLIVENAGRHRPTPTFLKPPPRGLEPLSSG